MRTPLFFLLNFIAPVSLFGQVVIHEISATSNDRIFSRDANGVARLGGGTQWWETAYDDSPWSTGTTPIGFGYGDISTNVSSGVQGITPTLYLRHNFTASSSQASSTQNLTLLMDYDDSFIAYINGKEVARRDAGAPGTPHYPDQVSFNSNTANGTGTNISLGAANQHLVSGDNVLAIEIHNDAIDSGTLKAKATLRTSSVTHVASGDSCQWFPGVIFPSGGIFDYAFINGARLLFAEWGAPEYDDSAWTTGTGPLGYETSGNNPYALGTNLGQMRNNQTSLFMRTTFTLTAAQLAAITQLELTVDYDDGYIAYLNGHEVSRGTMGNAGTPASFNDLSTGSHGASTDNGGTFDPDVLTIDKSALRVGENILAGQVHNSTIGSSDLILYLQLGDGTNTFVPSNASYQYFIGTSEPAGGGAEVLAGEVAFSDWIELYNPSGSSVDLTDWGLSDDPTAPFKWTFPAGTTIAPGGYLVVHADDQEEFNGPSTAIHAGFKLSSSGEDVVLTSPTNVTNAIPGGYPQQYVNHSYGWDATSMSWGYLETPTPGGPNSSTALSDRVDAPDFSPKGGFFDSTTAVTLTSNTPGATIRYTLNGVEPTENNSFVYSNPLTLSQISNKKGHVVRARAFLSGQLPSKSKTHTYLIGQDSRLKDVPALIFSGDEDEIFYKPHGIMSIEGGTYVGQFDDWQENGPLSYNIPLGRGQQYERPVHLEFYLGDGTAGFREDAGVRLSSSGWSRPKLRLTDTGGSPWASDPTQKPSFNLYFRDDYGTNQLNYPWLGENYPATNFEQLRIRAGKNDIRDPFIVDETVRRMFVEMGQQGSVGITNTLYINGEFKGFFNMCERLREPFMQSHHGGSEDWDVRQVNDYANGDITTWNTMMNILNRSGNGDLSLSDWNEALDYLDPVNMADYFLINIYGATWDWPQNNWVGARERSPEGRYRLYVWDAEGSFLSQSYFNPRTHNSFTSDLLSKTDTLSQLFQGLIKSPEWRLIFADRINKHMFNDGVLDDRNGLNSRFGEITTALKNEQQPLLNFVHGQSVNTNYFTNWTSSSSGRRNYLFGPSRTDFADNNLWPSVSPVNFNLHGGTVNEGFPLAMTSPNGGTIYYTLDGSDPRLSGGVVNPAAQTYSSAELLSQGTTIAMARARVGNTWSALTEAEFNVALTQPTSANLVISEFIFHPPKPSVNEMNAGFLDDDDFEFIELMNVSGSDVIDLKNLAFSGALTFNFSAASVTSLAPGQRVLLVNDRAAFTERYGIRSNVIGTYSGSLSNNSETLTLSLIGGATIHRFTYDDEAPWPICADGLGHSLVLKNPTTAPDHNLPTSWECSAHFGGDLGGTPVVFDYTRWREQSFSASQLTGLTAPGADFDGDGLSNFLEYIYGTSPTANNSPILRPSSSVITSGGNEYPVISIQRSSFDLPINLEFQSSSILSGWNTEPSGSYTIVVGPINPDGTRSENYRSNEPISDHIKRFYRLKFSTQP